MGMMHIILRRGGGSARSSVSTTKNVFSAIHRLDTQRRGRSNAASVPSPIPESSKVRKRVSKDERQAMVESYVNTYRGSHAGKFPSISDAQKQVGGSYYFVRKIIQELEHKSKISSSNSGNKNILGKELPIPDESLADVRNVSTGGAKLDSRTLSDSLAVCLNDVGNTSNGNLEVKERLWISEMIVLQEEGHSNIDATQNPLVGIENHVGEHRTNDASRPTHGKADDDQEKLFASKRVMNSGHPRHNKGPSEQQTGDAELPKESTLWGNLKSFANGIVSIWRKM